MKLFLSLALVVFGLAACGDSASDRLHGTWVHEGSNGREVTVFRKNGSVLHVKPAGDSLSGLYTFVNDSTVKVDLIDAGDSLAYLWQLDFRGDSLYVRLPNSEQVGWQRSTE